MKRPKSWRIRNKKCAHLLHKSTVITSHRWQALTELVCKISSLRLYNLFQRDPKHKNALQEAAKRVILDWCFKSNKAAYKPSNQEIKQVEHRTPIVFSSTYTELPRPGKRKAKIATVKPRSLNSKMTPKSAASNLILARHRESHPNT